MLKSVRQNSSIASQIVKVNSLLLFIKLSLFLLLVLSDTYSTVFKFDSSLLHDTVNYSKLQVKKSFETIQVRSTSQSNHLIKKMQGTEKLGF